ncbi:threonine/homoserine efflux transporter RhtA [Pseudomonas duriflava]|uniref:Threonine/homoserine efflux transporter RhtA n=1 Tax=Pseudomonas duriflava TaxID=459528 RepID=A0A562Q6F2_9PSED|nr:EamA family transporter [Pseudomonas duriflava]TWI52303.1 threonine/homoserine efflux transporter RhtA [Pseudomonas duriflava]
MINVFWRQATYPVWMADLVLLLVAILWGSSYSMVKYGLLFYPVLGFLAIRFCLTSLLLLPKLRGDGRKALVPGLPLGLMLLAIFLCETFGVALTTATNAAFLISLFVVFTPLVEWWMLRRRPSNGAFFAAMVSLIGTWLLTSGESAEFKFNQGDALMVAAAGLRALSMCLTKRLMRDRAVPALALTAAQTAVVGLGCLGVAFSLPAGLPPLPTALAFWLIMGYLVLFCTLFAFVAQNHAIRHTSPSRVSLLMGSEPLFGALFAVLWLDESLNTLAWIGGLLIVAAALWATRLRQGG